jgi:hypothetical protein
MESYSETKIFTFDEIALVNVVPDRLAMIPDREGVTIRCHELVRAVGRLFKLEVADGFYGFVEHSWLWTTPLPKELSSSNFRLGFPNILDVYSVGQLPMVRLVACGHPQLPHIGWSYRPGPPRTDIDEVLVTTLINDMDRD